MKKDLPAGLSLNKATISRLTTHEMDALKGGFTYSLSTGAVCRDSNARWHNILAENGTVAPVVIGADTTPSQMQSPGNADECHALPEAPPN